MSFESLWVGKERDVEGLGTALEDGLRAAVMNALRGHETNARVAVGIVVPLEEVLAMGACILDAAESLGELGPVFECFELRLRIRIVIGDMRPAVGGTFPGRRVAPIRA